MYFIVWFKLDGKERHERVDTNNANFARTAIEARYPGAIVGMILAAINER